MKYLLLLFLACNSLLVLGNSYPADSVGVEKDKGKLFILHKVEDKETLYSLSRRYDVSIYNIVQNNPPVEFGLEVGQVIRIPYEKKKKKEKGSQPAAKETQLAQNTTKELPEDMGVSSKQSAPSETIHVVKAKETIFSISRMYNVTIADLKKWNSLEGNILNIGQKLIIKKSTQGVRQVEDKQATTNRNTNITHEVKSGETLYAISRQYNVSVSEIKKWNNLNGNEISIGQPLIVGKKKNSASDDTTTEASPAADNSTQKESIKNPESESAVGGSTAQNTDNRSSTFEEIVESGNAELIPGTDDTRKYLALHKKAKVGTILRVRNEMNGQEVFVRVMGKLPDTGVNDNLLIKISKSAYDRLGAIDAKFRVTVSYIP